MKNLGLTPAQAAMLERILRGEPLGPRTAAQTYVLHNLLRIGAIKWLDTDIYEVDESWRVRWAKREER